MSCSDRFSSLVGEVWISCCVVSMSYGKQNPDYPSGGTVVCDIVADSSRKNKVITAPLINAASP